MLKLFGMLTVLTSSLMMGFVMARELRERTKLLRDIHQSAIHIKTDLEYRAPDICECFCRRGKLFSLAHAYMTKESLLPREALAKAADKLNFLSKEDKEVINMYADNLEQEDLGGQIANVSWLIENIALRIKDSEAEYQSKNRLYKSGGAIVGLGVVILLL